MLRLAPRVFSALRLRSSQAARLLAAPIQWWRGGVRPRTHRRPAARITYLRQWSSFRPRLEMLETRELLNSTPGLPDLALVGNDLTQLSNDAAQLRNDMTASAVTVANAVQPSSTNTPTMASLESQESKAWSVLVADWDKTWQAFVQAEYDMLGLLVQRFDTLLDDLGFHLPGRTSSTPPTTTNSGSSLNGQTAQAPFPSSAPPGGSVLPPVRPASDPADPPSTTSLSAAGTGQLKQSETFTATVTGSSGTPTGTVKFLDGTTVLGTVNVNSSGQATYQTSTLTLGSHNITAIYSGSTTYGSSDAARTQIINYATSTTSLSSSSITARLGNTVTFTATVTGNSGAPTGTVKFLDGTTVLGTVAVNSSGQAAYQTSTLNVGNHDITAIYSGDSTYAGSNASLTESVSRFLTYVTLTPSVSPSQSGQSVTFTAEVDPQNPRAGTPIGSVTFYDSNTVLSTATLDSNGIATFTTSSLASGDHIITAIYGGTDPFGASSMSVTQTVGQSSSRSSLTSVVLSSSGQTVTLTATVTGSYGTPTGSVTFYNGTSVLGSATLDGSGIATLTMSSMPLNYKAITTIYGGDSTYVGSSDLTLPNTGLATSTTQLTSSASPTLPGQAVTLTATVNGSNGTPTGSVTFYNGTSVLGTATLDGSAHAVLSTSALSLGNQTLTAIYNGDNTYTGSTASLTQTINLPLTLTSMGVSANPSQPSQPVTLTATVTSSDPGTPTGSVAFYDGTTFLGTSSLGGGGATLSVAPPLASQYLIAIYSGDSNYVSSTAPLQWQGVPTYSWTQSPVANPSVTPPGAQTNTEGDNASLQVTASDPNHYPLSYDALDLPPGLSINSSTGLISGTVAYGAAEDFDDTYTPTVIVANNQGGSTQATFSWTINQAQIAPTIDPPDQTNLRGDTVSLQVTASQVDNDPLTYTAANLPLGLSIDPDTGLISGTVDPSATLGVPSAVTVTATDDSTNLSTNQTFNWTIEATNVAPVLTSPGNQTNAAGDDVSLQLSTSDADGDNLTYTASGLPPGLTLDPIAGTITGTLPNSAASSTPYNVTVTASDGSVSNSQSFTWTVNVVSLQSPGDQSNLDGDSGSLQLLASDANNDTLTYSATGLPTGLSINSSTGLISGTISNTDDTSSPYSVTVTATDSAHNSASQSFTWTVARLALNPVSDQENQEGTAVSLRMSATDVPGTPTYSATGLPSGLSINSSTGLISGTVGVGAFGSSPFQVTVTATDGSYTSSQSFVWTVTPRVALINPGAQSNATGDSVSLQVSASSPGGTMTYSASGLPGGLSINSSSGLISGTLPSGDASSTPYTVTVTANDGTSSSSQTFAWTISAINLVSPGDQANNDGDTVSLPLTTGYHGSGTLSYSATGLPTGLSINSSTGKISGTLSGSADTNSPYSVTVTATAGTNTANQTFNWTINAVVSIDPIDDQSNADGDVVSLQVSASDSLDNTLSYSATGLPSGLTISSTTGLISGTIAAGADASSPYAVTVTATDSAGNSASQTLNWTVTPVGLVNPGPQASVDGQTVSLQLQGSSGATYSATGLLSGVSINSSTGLISGTLASNADTGSPYVVTATATLGSNNVSQTFVWTVTPTGLAAVSDQTNTEGDSVSLQLPGLSSGGSLTYSASGLPDGLSLNSTTGLITGTVAAGDAAFGPYTVDVAVTNGTVSTSQTFTWNINPVVNLTAAEDQSNNEGDSVSVQISATDSLHNTLTYSADGLPAGVSINSSTSLISGTISSGDAANSPYIVTVTANDGTYSSSAIFAWNVTHTDTTALTMTNPGTQTNVAGDSINLQINASDPDGIDTLSYSATGLLDGVDIDPYSGLISGTMADDAVSSTPYSVTVTADDGNGRTISQTFTWLVNAPVIVDPPSPVSAVEGQDTGSITVATFTTPDLNSQADDFTATIDWGDGNSDAGAVSGSDGNFTLTYDHTYAEMGSYTVAITVTDAITGYSTTDTTTATVTDAPLTLTGGFELGAIQQQSSNLTLATFTDGNPNSSLSDYTATINWGDGSGNQAATVSDTGDGVFAISGSHPYSQDGTYTTSITVTDVDGATATATSTVVVGDIYAGISSALTVANFTDIDHNTQLSSYTATIQWGDGTQSNGTVTGALGVQGTHTYAQDSIDQPGGVYTVTVSITDSDGATLTSTGTVTVVRPPMSGLGNDVESQSTALNNVQVAEFTEPDTTDGPSEFSATINWGDGNSVSGTIQEVSPGMFEVLGSHSYAGAGSYSIQVEVSQDWNSSLLAMMTTSTVVIGAAPQISGPSVVPGDSVYQYIVPIPPGDTAALGEFTFDNNAAKNAGQGYLYGNVGGKRIPTDFFVDVQFSNQPAVVNIGLNGAKLIGANGSVVAFNTTPLQVKVVRVTVQDPPQPLLAFSPGTPSDAGFFLPRGGTIDGRTPDPSGVFRSKQYQQELVSLQD